MTGTHPPRITSLEELKTLATVYENGTGGVECFISLGANGGMKTSKTIKYYPEAYECENELWGGSDDPEDEMEPEETSVFNETDYIPMGEGREGVKVHWDVYHDIDGTWAEYTNDKALEEHTHIIEALNNGALYDYAFTNCGG